MIKLMLVMFASISLIGCHSIQRATLNADIAMIKAHNDCSGAALKLHERLGNDPLEVYERCLDIRLGYN